MPPSTIGKDNTDEITCIAASPYSAELVAGYASGHVIVYDVDTGKRVRSFLKPSKVKAVAFGHRYIVWGYENGDAFKWSNEDGAVPAQLVHPYLSQPSIRAIAVYHNTSAIALIDGRVRPWNLIDAYRTPSLMHVSPVTTVAFSFDGRLLAVGTEAGTICVWSTDEWNIIDRYNLGDHPITQVVFKDEVDGFYAFNGGMWQCFSGYHTRLRERWTEKTKFITMAPNGRFFMETGQHGYFMLNWIRNPNHVRGYGVDREKPAVGIAVSSCSQYAFYTNGTNGVRVYDIFEEEREAIYAMLASTPLYKTDGDRAISINVFKLLTQQ